MQSGLRSERQRRGATSCAATEMAGLQWFQARGDCQAPSQSTDLPPTSVWWCLCRLPRGRSWGPARHLHALLWPSSDWVITLWCCDNSTVPETRAAETLFPDMMQRESQEDELSQSMGFKEKINYREGLFHRLQMCITFCNVFKNVWPGRKDKYDLKIQLQNHFPIFLFLGAKFVQG